MRAGRAGRLRLALAAPSLICSVTMRARFRSPYNRWRVIDEDAERAWARDWLMHFSHAQTSRLIQRARKKSGARSACWPHAHAQERTLSVYSGLVQDAEIRLALEPFTHAGPWGRLLDADAARLSRP